MAPTKRNGRPPIEWNSSRRRKVVRLYFMTNLNISKIRESLKEEGFHPCLRNIQTQLKALLPPNTTGGREFRPSRDQMQNRLSQLKRAKSNQVSKYQRKRAVQSMNRAGAVFITYQQTEQKTSASSPAIEGESHSLASSDNSSPSSNLPSLEQKSNSNENHSTAETGFSDKEVVFSTTSSLPSIQQGSSAVAENLVTDDHSPDEILKDTMLVGDDQRKESPASGSLLKRRITKSISSRMGSMRSVLSNGSIKTTSTRVSSPFSSLRHVGSVLSSASWRSSIVYADSISSGRPATLNNSPWTRDEFNSWNEFVDETNLGSFPSLPKDYKVKSLQSRPCCDFVDRDTLLDIPNCQICGYSIIHKRARFAAGNFSSIDPSKMDRFGNTPLHHAAAAGNTAMVLELMSAESRPSPTNSQQNSSGETFLHVFRLRGSEQFPEYEGILRKAYNSGFPIDILDYSGRTVSDRFEDLLGHWALSSKALSICASILKVRPLECQEGKLKLIGTEFNWTEFQNAHGQRKTALISALKIWPKYPKSKVVLERIIRESNIHIRDRSGHTALAIATAHGIFDAVSLLLKLGANPNTRSYHRTSVMENAAIHLSRAKKENKDILYTQILSCINLVGDHGGKASVTVFDEYSIGISNPDKSRKNGVRSVLTKVLKTTRKVISASTITLGSSSRARHIPASINGISDDITQLEPHDSSFNEVDFCDPDPLSNAPPALELSGETRCPVLPELPETDFGFVPRDPSTYSRQSSQSSHVRRSNLRISTNVSRPSYSQEFHSNLPIVDELSFLQVSPIESFNADYTISKQHSQSPLRSSTSSPSVAEAPHLAGDSILCSCGYDPLGRAARASNLKRHQKWQNMHQPRSDNPVEETSGPSSRIDSDPQTHNAGIFPIEEEAPIPSNQWITSSLQPSGLKELGGQWPHGLSTCEAPVPPNNVNELQGQSLSPSFEVGPNIPSYNNELEGCFWSTFETPINPIPPDDVKRLWEQGWNTFQTSILPCHGSDFFEDGWLSDISTTYNTTGPNFSSSSDSRSSHPPDPHLGQNSVKSSGDILTPKPASWTFSKLVEYFHKGGAAPNLQQPAPDINAGYSSPFNNYNPSNSDYSNIVNTTNTSMFWDQSPPIGETARILASNLSSRKKNATNAPSSFLKTKSQSPTRPARKFDVTPRTSELFKL
ncbi:hypothetical protein G7Y89_g6615 [Cudoniella acicularis]|uniref:Ankyrin n=1 Tax=Cudoniella acicularis TaxID=354080 RepID=A0A8H4W2P2_9HELO|nr:hypothetical protein G7Y89_g6615 [Cudoniella acicularis]